MYRRNDGEKDRETFADQGTVEIFREKTIEDMIDEQRAKLAAEGKVSPTTLLMRTRSSLIVHPIMFNCASYHV